MIRPTSRSSGERDPGDALHLTRISDHPALMQSCSEQMYQKLLLNILCKWV